jgi:hypothetical protein
MVPAPPDKVHAVIKLVGYPRNTAYTDGVDVPSGEYLVSFVPKNLEDGWFLGRGSRRTGLKGIHGARAGNAVYLQPLGLLEEAHGTGCSRTEHPVNLKRTKGQLIETYL